MSGVAIKSKGFSLLTIMHRFVNMAFSLEPVYNKPPNPPIYNKKGIENLWHIQAT